MIWKCATSVAESPPVTIPPRCDSGSRRTTCSPLARRSRCRHHTRGGATIDDKIDRRLWSIRGQSGCRKSKKQCQSKTKRAKKFSDHGTTSCHPEPIPCVGDGSVVAIDGILNIAPLRCVPSPYTRIYHRHKLQRRAPRIDLGAVPQHQTRHIGIMHRHHHGLCPKDFHASYHRRQMLFRLFGREKLLLVQRVVRAREENNISRPELPQRSIQPGIQLGRILSRKSIVDNARLRLRRKGKEQSQQ